MDLTEEKADSLNENMWTWAQSNDTKSNKVVHFFNGWAINNIATMWVSTTELQACALCEACGLTVRELWGDFLILPWTWAQCVTGLCCVLLSENVRVACDLCDLCDLLDPPDGYLRTVLVSFSSLVLLPFLPMSFFISNFCPSFSCLSFFLPVVFPPIFLSFLGLSVVGPFVLFLPVFCRPFFMVWFCQ